jgi:hypothetical protein
MAEDGSSDRLGTCLEGYYGFPSCFRLRRVFRYFLVGYVEVEANKASYGFGVGVIPSLG